MLDLECGSAAAAVRMGCESARVTATDARLAARQIAYRNGSANRVRLSIVEGSPFPRVYDWHYLILARPRSLEEVARIASGLTRLVRGGVALLAFRPDLRDSGVRLLEQDDLLVEPRIVPLPDDEFRPAHELLLARVLRRVV